MNTKDLIEILKMVDLYLYAGDRENAHLIIVRLLEKLAKS